MLTKETLTVPVSLRGGTTTARVVLPADYTAADIARIIHLLQALADNSAPPATTVHPAPAVPSGAEGA